MALTGVKIEIIAGKDWDGPRLTSEGSPAKIILDRIATDPDRVVLGDATGRFSATLCAATGMPAVVDRTQCQTLTGSFVTGLQFPGF